MAHHRRLEDRIRELCTRAVTVSESQELHDILGKLRAALREHTQRLRRLAVKNPIPPDRRIGL